VSRRAAAWVAWSTVVLCALLISLSVYLNSRHAVGPDRFTVGDLVWVVAFLGFPAVGALIASRRPGNPIGWLFCTAGVTLGLSSIANEYAILALLVEPGSLAGGAEAAWVDSWVWAPGFACIVLSVLLFPTGRPPTPRWWWVGALVLAGMALVVGPGAILAWSVRGPRLLDETQPGSGSLWVLANAGFPLMVAALLAAVLSLLVRFRRAGGTERQQIKWLAYAGALEVFTIGLTEFLLKPLGVEGSAVEDFLTGLPILAIPLSVGVAIFRYRLYDIDVLINRTFVYGTLTATLIAVYFGGVAATQALLRTLTGQEEQSQLAIVVSTLAIAALFSPLRYRIQSFIDRRFYRRKYDARKTLEAFATKLREGTDLETLNEELVGVVSETMQPVHITLWLRLDPDSQRLKKG
jgi:hypothetical protein